MIRCRNTHVQLLFLATIVAGWGGFVVSPGNVHSQDSAPAKPARIPDSRSSEPRSSETPSSDQPRPNRSGLPPERTSDQPPFNSSTLLPERNSDQPPLDASAVLPERMTEQPPARDDPTPPGLFDRLREGPPPIPDGGPQPNQYGEPMLFGSLIGSAEKKKYPIVNVGGVFQILSVFYSQTPANRESVGDEYDGTGIKRSRLTMYGSVAENVDYRFQFDLGTFGRPTITDMYIDINEAPFLGHIRIGQWKQPFSLEEVTSFRFNPFIDRSSLFIFSPFRRTGIGFFDWSEDMKWTWTASAFRGFQDFYGNDLSSQNGYGGAGRVTHCFQYENDGEQVLHFGANYAIIAPTGQNAFMFGRFGGNSPELGLIQGQVGTSGFRQNQSMVQTPVLNTNPMYYQIFHLDTAWVHGPFSVQAEGSLVPIANNGNLVPGSKINGTPLFGGAYIFMTYFLTGEHRVYDRNLAVFDRVIPRNDSRAGHFLGGAWEVGVRLNYITLNSAGIYGGQLLDPTFALNWYMNPYTRMSFNYIPVYLKQGDIVNGNTKNSPNQRNSQASVFGLQAQVDF